MKKEELGLSRFLEEVARPEGFEPRPQIRSLVLYPAELRALIA